MNIYICIKIQIKIEVIDTSIQPTNHLSSESIIERDQDQTDRLREHEMTLGEEEKK